MLPQPLQAKQRIARIILAVGLLIIAAVFAISIWQGWTNILITDLPTAFWLLYIPFLIAWIALESIPFITRQPNEPIIPVSPILNLTFFILSIGKLIDVPLKHEYNGGTLLWSSLAFILVLSNGHSLLTYLRTHPGIFRNIRYE